MIFNSLSEIASYIVSDGKGILAADESNPTCTKRFDSIGVESTEDNRRDYRELLFRSEGMKGNIGGVILFDETIRQNAADGTSLVDIITSQGSIPGIKVDKGLQQIGDTEESLTQGLEGLDSRLKEYYGLGAKFTKWRAVYNISKKRLNVKPLVTEKVKLEDFSNNLLMNEEDIKKTSVAIMYSSGSCVECLLHGVPVISTDPSSYCYELFSKKLEDIDNIDDIELPNIGSFLSAISNTHFTLEEIVNGDFWKIQKGL